MNDSLRTDVFVRYPPETIAVACIYLSARKLKVALPKNPTWFQVLAVEEDDIKECCYSMICLYNRKKVCRTNPLHVITIFIFCPTLCNTVGFFSHFFALLRREMRSVYHPQHYLFIQPNQEELEGEVESLRRKQDQSRRAARGDHAGTKANDTTSNTPNASTPPSRSGSPAKNAAGGGEKGQGNNGHHHHHGSSREKIEYENGTNR